MKSEHEDYDLDLMIQFARTRLIQRAEIVIDICNRVIINMKNLSSPNSLGELQAQGPALDAACGELAALIWVQQQRDKK